MEIAKPPNKHILMQTFDSSNFVTNQRMRQFFQNKLQNRSVLITVIIMKKDHVIKYVKVIVQQNMTEHYMQIKLFLKNILQLVEQSYIFSIDLLLPGCCNRFSCSLKKLCSQLAKIKITTIHPLSPHTIPSFWMSQLTHK